MAGKEDTVEVLVADMEQEVEVVVQETLLHLVAMEVQEVEVVKLDFSRTD